MLFCCLTLAGGYPNCSSGGLQWPGTRMILQETPVLPVTIRSPLKIALKPHVIKHGLLENTPCYLFGSMIFPAVNLHLVQGFPSHFWLPQSMCMHGPLYHFTILWICLEKTYPMNYHRISSYFPNIIGWIMWYPNFPIIYPSFSFQVSHCFHVFPISVP